MARPYPHGVFGIRGQTGDRVAGGSGCQRVGDAVIVIVAVGLAAQPPLQLVVIIVHQGRHRVPGHPDLGAAVPRRHHVRRRGHRPCRRHDRKFRGSARIGTGGEDARNIIEAPLHGHHPDPVLRFRNQACNGMGARGTAENKDTLA